MKKIAFGAKLLFLFLFMLVLIFDAKICLEGAKEGIDLCLASVIPSLLPFIFLSILLTGSLIGRSIPLFLKIARSCGIPDGAESLLLMGLIGGYPVGATMISNTYKQGRISKCTAERMLGFCNNTGPAFIFGMVAILFENQKILGILWLIQIISALLVGFLLPGKTKEKCSYLKSDSASIVDALESAIKAMANICSWVILFRILQSFLDRWLLWLCSNELRSGILGILELTNGILSLKNIENPSFRFVLCTGMLSLGGLCVFMQTVSVTKGLKIHNYFLGKVMQCIISVLLSVIICPWLFQSGLTFNRSLVITAIWMVLALFFIFFILWKKSSSISSANVV